MTSPASPPVKNNAPGSELQVKQLLALNQAAIEITGELELDRLLQRIVDAARALAGCRYAALGVLGDDGFIERFPTSGLSEVDREKIGELPRGHGLLGVMLRAGRTIRIPDINKDSRRVGFPPHHPPMTSLLGVPIFVQGKLAGDLYMTDKIGQPEFSEEDEWLLQLLATHAATALTNARLHSENVRALSSLQVLHRVTRAISHSVQLDEVIPVIVKSAVELVGAEAAAVYLFEGEDQQLELLPDLNDDEEQVVVGRYSLGLAEPLHRMLTLPFARSVAGRALRSGETQIVDDTAREREMVFPLLQGDRKVGSLVAVPLIAGGDTIGVLSAYWHRPGAFGLDAVALVEAFGAQASTALQNARLYRHAERGREAAEKEQQRLREVEQMKDEFLSTAAHELRTPLTAIRMAAGLAHEQLATGAKVGGQETDGRVLHLMGLVVEGSERLHSLVNDLLDLTRLEQGRATLHVENLDLREVVTSTVDTIAPLLDSKKQSISLQLPEAPYEVRGDRQRLEQVVINLLSNAHKYSPEGTPVAVRVVRATGQDGEKEYQVSVRDKGPGIPEGERELIFERFFRSSLHRKDRTPSTGLGLPIARKIAEMHRGRLWVEPAPLGGSIFTLALPLPAPTE